MKRNTRFHRRALLLVTPSHLSHLGEDDDRRDSVRLDIERPPFGSHDARQHVQPALGGAVGGMSSHPTLAARDEILIILPRRCAIIPGATNCASKNGARRLTA